MVRVSDTVLSCETFKFDILLKRKLLERCYVYPTRYTEHNTKKNIECTQ